MVAINFSDGFPLQKVHSEFYFRPHTDFIINKIKDEIGGLELEESPYVCVDVILLLELLSLLLFMSLFLFTHLFISVCVSGPPLNTMMNLKMFILELKCKTNMER